MDAAKRHRVRVLNDELRQTWLGGRTNLSRSLLVRGHLWTRQLLEAIAKDGGIDEARHPDHDFGSVTFEGQRYVWSIDYYTRDFRRRASDPTDEDECVRVFRVMPNAERFGG